MIQVDWMWLSITLSATLTIWHITPYQTVELFLLGINTSMRSLAFFLLHSFTSFLFLFISFFIQYFRYAQITRPDIDFANGNRFLIWLSGFLCVGKMKQTREKKTTTTSNELFNVIIFWLMETVWQITLNYFDYFQSVHALDKWMNQFNPARKKRTQTHTLAYIYREQRQRNIEQNVSLSDEKGNFIKFMRTFHTKMNKRATTRKKLNRTYNNDIEQIVCQPYRLLVWVQSCK